MPPELFNLIISELFNLIILKLKNNNNNNLVPKNLKRCFFLI